MELSHAKDLTGENVDLVPLWDAFLDDRFSKAEKFGRNWLKDHVDRALGDIERNRKKYRAFLTRMQKQEKGKMAEQHRKKRHQKQVSFEKIRECKARSQAAKRVDPSAGKQPQEDPEPHESGNRLVQEQAGQVQRTVTPS